MYNRLSFYVLWSTAHFMFEITVFNRAKVAVQGMGHLFAIGIRSGPWC